MRKLLCQLNFGLGDDGWIENHSHIFGTSYYMDIFKFFQFLLPHLPFRAHLDFERLHLADMESSQIYSELNMANWWLDTQDQLPAGVTILPVICACDKTCFTNISGDQDS